MKKKLYALSGVFLIVLVIAGLWATRATDLYGVEQTVEQSATSMDSGLTMQKMTEESSLIVIGKCVGTRSQWIEGRRLVTLATVEVEEALKGDPSGTALTVVLPGGFDANRKFPVAMKYAGAPQMSNDEEVALFLVPAQDEIANGYAVMGFAQGKYSVGQDSGGGKVVTRDMTKAPVQTGPGAIRGNLQVMPLAEFKALVRRYLK